MFHNVREIDTGCEILNDICEGGTNYLKFTHFCGFIYIYICHILRKKVINNMQRDIFFN